MNELAESVGFREAFRYWVKLGFISFGGPAGQIAIMQRDLVDRQRWISQERFLHALSYCMLLPGPEAQQLAIYIGWLLHGTWGGVVAGAFFVIPSVFILWGLSAVYAAYGSAPARRGHLRGAEAGRCRARRRRALEDRRRALRPRGLVAIAAAAFVGDLHPRMFRFPGSCSAPGSSDSCRAESGRGLRRRPADSARIAGGADPASDQSRARNRGGPRLLVAARSRILAVGLLLWGAPFLALGSVARLVEPPRLAVPLLHAGGVRDLRRRVRGPRLRHAGGRPVLPLDHAARRSTGWASPRRRRAR